MRTLFTSLADTWKLICTWCGDLLAHLRRAPGYAQCAKVLSILMKPFMPIARHLDAVFFHPITGRGFGVVRILWALTILIMVGARYADVTFLYSDAGLLPSEELGHLVFRKTYRFTIFNYIKDPIPVYLVFLTLMCTTFMTLIGKYTKLSTILTCLLLYSFHERNLLPLGGGDTVMRHVGFLLVLCPNISAFSVDRAAQSWKQWKKDRTLVDDQFIPIWIWRLALWQLMVIYLTSGWDKMLGTMWWDGSAPSAAFHHIHFLRFPMEWAHAFSWMSPIVARGTLIWEMMWMLLLIPAKKWKGWTNGYVTHDILRRIAVFGALSFHGGIFIWMEVGSFSPAMYALNLCLIRRSDIEWLRSCFNWCWRKKHPRAQIHLLYDDNCFLCRRTAFFLMMADWLKRLDMVNFHHEEKRKELVPHISFEDLDKAMHMKFPDGKELKGFDAFRRVSWHVPIFWPLVPFLYIPGVPALGHFIYGEVAKRRRKCTDDGCAI